MDTSYFYTAFDDDFLDLGDSDPSHYPHYLDSPCSPGSDIENQIYDPNLHPALFPASDCTTPLNNNNYNNNNNNNQKNCWSGKWPIGRKVVQRKAANMRERRRMKSINDAFEALRTCIPSQVQVDRRLSKVDTLRLAIRYIDYLAEVLKSCGDYNSTSVNNNRGQRAQEKIIVRCHLTELEAFCDEGEPLVGHSLTWHDARLPPDSRTMVGRLWTPHHPTEADLVNLASYSSEC